MAVLSSNPFLEEIPYLNGIYRARIFKSEREAFFPAHYHHTDLEILIPVNMKGDFHCDGKLYSVKHNSICFIAPGAIHSNRFKPEGNSAHFTLQINLKKLENLFKQESLQEFLSSIPPMVPDESGELSKIAFSLSQVWTGTKGSDNATLSDMISDLSKLFSMLRSISLKRKTVSAEKSKSVKVRRILDVVGPLGLGAKSLSEIAKRSAISKSHLCVIFKEATGMTLQNHILELRIQYASRLLEETEMNVTEAAEESGFENLSHFVRVFKKLKGTTPKQWAVRNFSCFIAGLFFVLT